MGRACAGDVDCEDEDACTSYERCDPAARTCVVDPLDGDDDGDPPRVCGGRDCDDSSSTVYGGAPERCNLADDDCDGTIDEDLDASRCSFCRTANSCGDEDMDACYVSLNARLDELGCSNAESIRTALGACASSSCDMYGACRDAAFATCACPAGGIFCGGYSDGACIDPSTDDANCGVCGRVCESDGLAPDSHCEAGACVSCGGRDEPCCTGLSDNCAASDLICSAGTCVGCGGLGQACCVEPGGGASYCTDASLACTGGACACASGRMVFGASCVDTRTDAGNCGTCDLACAAGEECSGGACLTLWERMWLEGVVNSVAVDGSGNVYVTGSFAGTVDFGGGPLTSAGGRDIFVASFTSAGAHRWSRRYGSTVGSDAGRSLALDGSGNVYVTGVFEGSVDFGGGPLTSAGLEDIFVASFTPAGAHRWSRSYGSTADDYGSSLALDGSGNVYITGAISGTMDFGDGSLTSAGLEDIFVASFTPAGAHRWSRRYGSTADDDGSSLALDGSANLYVTGVFEGSVDFGGGPLTSAGSDDIFVASFTPAGAYRWSRRYGASIWDAGLALAAGPGGVGFLGGFWGDPATSSPGIYLRSFPLAGP